jgi:hypothetical protein
LRLTIVSALLLICQVAAGQSTAPPSEPTLQETTQTIQSDLTGLSHKQQHSEVYLDTASSPPRETGRRVIMMEQSISSASIQACTLSIVLQSKAESVPAFVFTFDVPLQKLTSVAWTNLDIPTRSTPSVQVTEIPSRIGSIVFQTAGNLISDKALNLRDQTSSVEMMDTFRIPIDDERIGQKLVKALNRAATLCHAPSKLEPF